VAEAALNSAHHFGNAVLQTQSSDKAQEEGVVSFDSPNKTNDRLFSRCEAVRTYSYNTAMLHTSSVVQLQRQTICQSLSSWHTLFTVAGLTPDAISCRVGLTNNGRGQYWDVNLLL
jgi:hypothetical protein